ncbi:MAG TPA: hypothetical protein VEX86_20775 [Longimicrobium sp.]|nr:hypothetical protein [Longimicrobium sp.]
MSTDELRQALELAWNGDGEHVERLMLTAAILQTALREAGMEATLVGGGAIEVYVPESYTTSDIDLVVERRTRDDIDRVFTALGLSRSGRHWTRGDMYVEVPGNYLPEAVEEFRLGTMTLRVIRREHVLADRVVGWRHWKFWRYGLDAVSMLKAFGDTIDDATIRPHLRREGAEDAYNVLRELMESGEPINEESLEALWYRHYR